MPTRDDAPRYFVDRSGNYIGAFTGAEPPAGAVEVDVAPGDARQVYSAGTWQPLPPPNWHQRREAAIREQILGGEGALAVLVEVLVIEMAARGEAVSPEFTSLITKIQEIRAAYPKP